MLNSHGAAARLGRLVRGAGASLLSQGVNLAFHIVLLPVFLWVFGTRIYGAWLAISAATGLLALLHLGCHDHVINRLTSARARACETEYAQTLHSALGAALALGGLVAVALVAITFLLPVDAWLGTEELSASTVRWVVLLLGLQSVSSVPGGLLLGLYRSLGEFARGTLIHTYQRVTMLVFTLAAVATAPSLTLVAIAQLVPAIAFPVYALIDIRTRHPDIPFGLRHARLAVARGFLGPGMLFLAIQASQILGLQGARLLTGWTVGLTAVATLAAMTTLVNATRQLTACFLTPAWPESTALHAQRQLPALRLIHRVGTKTSLALTLPIVSFLGCSGPLVFSTWTLGQIPFDGVFASFLLLQLLLYSWSTASAICLMSWSRHGPVAVWRLAGTALGLGLGAALAQRFALSGLALGLCLGEILPACFLPRAVCRQTEDPWGGYLLQTALKTVLVAPLICGVPMGIQMLMEPFPPSWSIVPVLVSGFLVSFALLRWWWLDPSERRVLGDALAHRRVRKRRLTSRPATPPRIARR